VVAVDLDRLINRRTPELLDQFRRFMSRRAVKSREMLIALLTRLASILA